LQDCEKGHGHTLCGTYIAAAVAQLCMKCAAAAAAGVALHVV